MYFSTTTIVSILLASSSVLAAPHKKSSTGRRQSTRSLAKGTRALNSRDSNPSSNISFSSNWAGGVLESPPPSENFTFITGQFTVPTPSVPSGSPDGTYSAAIWVGIDGASSLNSAILQAGVDVTAIQSNGTITTQYDSWYEWFPAGSTSFDPSQFNFTAGDTITVSCESYNSTTGSCTLNNLSTGQVVFQPMSAPDDNPSSALVGQDAEWIVEDYSVDSGLVAFADFGTVVFEDAWAGTGEQMFGTNGSTIWEITDSNGNLVANSTIPDDQSVEVSWV